MAVDVRDVVSMQEGITSQIRQASQVLSDNDSGYDIGCDIMDDSLTDMQWLQKMDASAEIPGMKRGGQSRKRRANFCEKAGNESKALLKESCRKKLDYSSVKKGTNNKPPLSYASLIALAICSTPQRMLTLSGIYRWIESTFPFYRTPEAKAWKNSIRHNLSIRKGMFMKVYQYPPRRGNGSYWTLLSDGEDELKRAIPLFSTLQPPVIDPDCVYNRVPMTHTVRSRGQFIPVLPRSDAAVGSQPYFSVCSSAIDTAVGQIPQEEAVVLQSSEDVIVESGVYKKLKGGHKTNVQAHLLDHSYAKQLPNEVYNQQQSPNVVMNNSVDIEATTEAPLRRKDKRMIKTPVKKQGRFSRSRLAVGKENVCSQPDFGTHTTSFAMTTPSRDQDISLSFLDSSLLTPLKDLVNNIEIGPQGISLSPLYANFVSPSSSDTPKQPTAGNILPSPLTPLKYSNVDSGIFTPFQPTCTDSLDSLNMKCSTPVGFLSPIASILPPNTFSTPQQDPFLPLKVLDNSTESTSTPIRLGSLQELGLPGLTPPSTLSR